MTDSLDNTAWLVERLDEALQALATQLGFSIARHDNKELPSTGGLDADPLAQVEFAAARLGLEAEPVEEAYTEIPALICRGAPALLHLAAMPSPCLLVLLPGGRRGPVALGPDLRRYKISPQTIRETLCRPLEAPAIEAVNAVLNAADIPQGRRHHARQALLNELLAGQRVSGIWLIRPAAAAPLWEQAREWHLGRLGIRLVGAHFLYFVLWIFSWWLLGRGALEGHLDPGWLTAWGLVLLTLIPLRMLATHAGELLSVRAGAWFKRRLLYAALRLEPEEIRHQGAGQLLGRVMDSEALEQMAITGGLLGVTALVELTLSMPVLAGGAGGGFHLLWLLAWMAVTAWMARRYFYQREAWTEERLAMTNEMVEGMVGYRTRLAQEPREHWHEAEDRALDRYYTASRALDHTATGLQALVPRGWFILGILGLVPAFVDGQSAGLLAIGVGGVLLAYQAFHDLANGLEQILAAVVAGKRIRLFWEAASRFQQIGSPAPLVENARVGPSRAKSPLLDVRDLTFRYPDRAEPVVRGLSLQIGAGDRILLQGPSGGGKSTLGRLLAAGDRPASGLLLLDGLDPQTLGEAIWRQRVVAVPQFHENHVLMGTLAFNVLMGRNWPPNPKDLEAAQTICRALGLGPLLERMPAGLQQMVGETGWQLSHGERGRLYVARALLQGADLVILDESFAALDPQTLRTTLDYVLDSAPTLVVITHP
jgi:ATP-binding cassette subfamily B protein